MREDLGLVSVIIPAFNAELTLHRCLESVFRQTHEHLQVIVVNDGSTDATIEILRCYSGKIVYASQENQGPSAARNHGLRLAEGDFVAFLDADDYWLPNFLGKCLTFMKKYPEVDAVSTAQKIINWQGKIVITPPCIRNQKEKCHARVLRDFFDFWARQDHVRTGTTLFRRNLVEKAGFMREDLRIAEDLEYWGYLATWGIWGFIPEILWVGDSARQAGASGWLRKLKTRSKMVPTVEDWQKRIFPRLASKDVEGFRLVRGRVAQSFAYAKLLGGDIQGARGITQRYGEDFPDNHVSRLFKRLASKNHSIWRLLALALLSREAIKSYYLQKKMSQHTIKTALNLLSL